MAWGLAFMAGSAYVLTQVYPTDPSPEEPAEAPIKAPAVAPEKRPSRSGRIHRSTGARHALPHPEQPAAAAEVEEEDAPDGDAAHPEEEWTADEGEADGDSGALPQRGRAAEGVVFTPEALMDAMVEVTPDITDCVDDWQEVLEAELDGRLVMEMTLGPDGVIDAALVDVDGVPEPMIGCFGAVIYEAEWPLPEDVTDVAWPFRLTSE